MGRAEAGVAGKEDGMAALRTRRRNKVKESKGNKRASRCPSACCPPARLLSTRPSGRRPPALPNETLHFAEENVELIRIHYGPGCSRHFNEAF